MKKLLAVLLFTLLSSPAWAGVNCTLPFNFTPGSIADANQVMANYNALVVCMQNAAIAGINNDITALVGLTTPIGPAVGGTTSYTGTAGGTANAITIASTVPSSWTLLVNNRIGFLATGSNTGAVTLTVGATATLNLVRLTPSGLAPMAGGEIVSGQSVTAVYDGSQYQMVSAPALMYPPGVVFDYAGAACPTGSLETTGSSLISQTTFPTLFGIISTTWGPAGGGNFTIPDLRGRATFNRDSSGSARITVAGGNFDGTAIGNVGGQQNRVVGQGNLTNFSLVISDPGHTHGYTAMSTGGSPTPGGGSGFSVQSLTTVSSGTGIGVTSGGSSIPLPTLSNAAIVVKCIRG